MVWHKPCSVTVLQSWLHVSFDGSQKHPLSAWQAVGEEYALPHVSSQGGFCFALYRHIGCCAHWFASSRGQLLVQTRAVLSHMQALSALQADSDV
jgi:hypothetical protein